MNLKKVVRNKNELGFLSLIKAKTIFHVRSASIAKDKRKCPLWRQEGI
jgi:hypothetical protein